LKTHKQSNALIKNSKQVDVKRWNIITKDEENFISEQGITRIPITKNPLIVAGKGWEKQNEHNHKPTICFLNKRGEAQKRIYINFLVIISKFQKMP
jgi:hypothetical protein